MHLAIEIIKENILFNDALNQFYIGYMPLDIW